MPRSPNVNFWYNIFNRFLKSWVEIDSFPHNLTSQSKMFLWNEMKWTKPIEETQNEKCRGNLVSMIEVFKMHKTHSSTRIVDLTLQNGCRQVCQYDIPAFIHWISLKKIAIYCPKLINTNAYPNLYEQAHCVKKTNCFKQNHAVWNSNQEVPIVFFPKEKYKDYINGLSVVVLALRI